MKSNKTIEGSIPLYDTNDVESSVLLKLNNGYIIVDESTNEVSEFNLTKDNKYFNSASKHYVYGGPTESYEEKNNKLIDLKTNVEEKNKNKIQENILRFRENVKSKMALKSASPSDTPLPADGNYIAEVISGRIPNLDYNPNGICGSCAVANYLTWYSWNIYSGFVPQQYQNSVNSSDNGTQFIKSIVPYVDGEAALNLNNHGGSTPQQLKDGFTSYLSTNVPQYVGAVDLFDGQADPARVTGITLHGIPFILGLHSGDNNQYGNHWVVGIGYIYLSPNKFMPLFYKIIDGWGNNNTYINKGWSDSVVCLEVHYTN